METIQYKEEYGRVYFQQGFEEELRGKTIQEQMHCYCWLHGISSSPDIRGYYDRDYRTIPAYIKSFKTMCPFTSSAGHIPVVKDGLVVGLSFTQYRYTENREKESFQAVYLPYECFCYEYDEELDGSGHIRTYRNKYLVCLPYDHDLW